MPDQLNAFVPHGRVEIAGAAHGPLAGVTFALKDRLDRTSSESALRLDLVAAGIGKLRQPAAP